MWTLRLPRMMWHRVCTTIEIGNLTSPMFCKNSCKGFAIPTMCVADVTKKSQVLQKGSLGPGSVDGSVVSLGVVGAGGAKLTDSTDC